MPSDILPALPPPWIVYIGDPATERYCIVRAVDVDSARAAVRALPGMSDYGIDTVGRVAATTERGTWIVGKTYRGPNPNADGPDMLPYTCVAYDWRTGWWMRGADGSMRDVSERAIGRTFHEVRVPDVYTRSPE